MAGLRLRVPASLLASSAAWKRALWHFTSGDTPFDVHRLAAKIQADHTPVSGRGGITYNTALNWARRVERSHQAGIDFQDGANPPATNSMLRSPHLGANEPWMVRVFIPIELEGEDKPSGLNLALPFQSRPTMADVEAAVKRELRAIPDRRTGSEKAFGDGPFKLGDFFVQSFERR
jgi:hypothetical protein